jgi:N-acetylneuraminic acid mutarotase
MLLIAAAESACAPSLEFTGGSWDETAPLPEPLQELQAAILKGEIYVAGGFDAASAPSRAAYRYDPAADAWERIADLPAARHHMPLGGRLVRPDRNLNVVEAFDLAADRWTPRARMPSQRGGLASAALKGRIHTLGGETRFGVFENHEVYDPQADRWMVAPSMPTARHGLAAAADVGKLFAIGGGPRAGFAQTRVVEVYSP